MAGTLTPQIMIKHPSITIIALTITLAILLPACITHTYEQEVVEVAGPGLATQMNSIQHWSHKLGLSVEAENMELTDFYLHELEEAAEFLMETVEEYDGYPIAELTRAKLVPGLEALEAAVDSGNWEDIRRDYTGLVVSCNSCHTATDHGYIIITEGYGNNPFNQEF